MRCHIFYLLCSNWINQAVPGTVDLRALTVTKDKRAEEFAREENMTLAVESARSIGCRVMDDTEKRLLKGDSSASRQLVLDLVKVCEWVVVCGGDDLIWSCVVLIAPDRP